MGLCAIVHARLLIVRTRALLRFNPGTLSVLTPPQSLTSPGPEPGITSRLTFPIPESPSDFHVRWPRPMRWSRTLLVGYFTQQMCRINYQYQCMRQSWKRQNIIIKQMLTWTICLSVEVQTLNTLMQSKNMLAHKSAIFVIDAMITYIMMCFCLCALYIITRTNLDQSHPVVVHLSMSSYCV